MSGLLYYIGVDPGLGGGMACLDASGSVYTHAKMPTTEPSVLDWFQRRRSLTAVEGARSVVVLERVGGYVGGRGQPGSHMFNFGRGYGGLRMALVACGWEEGVDWFTVTPQKWQHRLGIVPRGRGEKPGDWKNRLKKFAQKLFPHLHVTLHTADALLIAHYCRVVYGEDKSK